MNKKHTRHLFAFALISFLSLSGMEIDEGGRGKRSLETMDLEGGYGKKSTDGVSPTGPIVCFNGEEIPVSNLSLWDLQLVFGHGKRNINEPFQNGLTPLMLACLNGDPLFVAALLNLNADANRVDQANYTALMHAAGTKGAFIPHIVQGLLDNGADPALQDIMGNTALSIAENTAIWIDPNDPCDKSKEVVDLLKNVTPTLQQP